VKVETEINPGVITGPGSPSHRLRREVNGVASSQVAPEHRTSPRPIGFSLFLWGNDDSAGRDKYRLMLEGAKYLDRAGFEAVWTPERHFHAFGGPYPNPSVAAAAITTVTDRIGIRAGSCVSPLHHPVRIAEEWAVVDNLSNGRVALAFASGWQVNDFILRPESYTRSKEVMCEQIDQVRRLWRGEKLSFPNPHGERVAIQTLPRPVQPELPLWITAAGNPETFRLAGELGANVLTHLLGKSIEDAAGKIELYRQARAAAGHDPATGRVTLMLHTFAGGNDDEVRELVRQPMKNYLRSSLHLVVSGSGLLPDLKRFVREGKPREVDLRDLSETEKDAMLEVAFERYFETGGLFGSPKACARTVERCRQAGVDEIACLMDFGVPTERVLGSLEDLNRVRERANAAFGKAESPTPYLVKSVNGSSLGHSLNGHRQTNAFLTRLEELKIHVAMEGDRLRCSAPPGVLTPALREELRRRKDEVLAFLSSTGALARQPRALVPLQSEGQGIPIFAVAGHNGDVFAYRALAKHLGNEQPFFGLQPPGLDGNDEPAGRVEALAGYFAGQIQSFRGDAPCIVAGYCAGGSVAFELARQLKQNGVPVEFLALFGAPFPSLYRPWKRTQFKLGNQWDRVARHARLLVSQSFSEQRRHVASVLRNRREATHPAGTDAAPDSAMQWRRRVEETTLQAIRSYRPGRFDGVVRMFLPSRHWNRGCFDVSRWRSVSEQVSEYFGPPGCDSDNMLREPNAPIFAALLKHATIKSTGSQS